MKLASSSLLNNYVELRPSPLHGFGLFAKKDIPKDTIWWKSKRSNVLLLNHSHYRTLQESHVNDTMDNLLNIASFYGYYSAKLDSIVICLDNARYVNHSHVPNSGAPSNGDPLSSVSLRDIYAGEEITEDYANYDACPWSKITCSDSFITYRDSVA
ncbi:MAG: SET domain-containing protein [Rubritalea sp.]|jgi:SET domain-containing protein